MKNFLSDVYKIIRISYYFLLYFNISKAY